MDSITLRIADTLLTGITITTPHIEDGKEVGQSVSWRVICHDVFSDSTCMGKFSEKEFNALVILAIAGETELLSKEVTDNAYEILSFSAAQHWPSNVRPYP